VKTTPKTFHRRGGLVCLALAATALGALLLASPAAADQVICLPGSDAGQCSGARGVAVDSETGLLYVADNGNKEVDVFDADDGSFLASFSVGSSLTDIAVDNDELSPAFHDVYVFDSTNNRVLRFHPDGELVLAIGEGQFASQPQLDVGPGGIVHVADDIGGGARRVRKFDHEGEPSGTISPLTGEALVGLAVDASGDFYLAGVDVRKYDSSGALLETFHSSFNIQTIALDAAGNLFVSDVTGVFEGGETAVFQYNPAGTLTRVFYGNGTLKGRPASLALYSSANGDVFAAESTSSPTGLDRVVHYVFPPPGPVVHPDPQQTKANPVGNTKATLNARINPEGKATTYRFEYVDDASYETEGGFASPKTKTTSEAGVVPPPDQIGLNVDPLFRLAPASAQAGCPVASKEAIDEGKCLAPETVYHFRAIAENADGEDVGPEGSFETKAPVEIFDTWATEVGTDAALVHAEVNPLGIPAAGRFQYVEEATYQQSGFAAATEIEVDFGGGEEALVRSVQLHPLKAGTAYRYRVVMENLFEIVEVGPERAFRTFSLPPEEPDACPNSAFRGGPAAVLPDCRAYEMVSPVDKEGGEIVVQATAVMNLPAVHDHSAAVVPAEGRGLTYSSYRAFGDAISAPYTSQYIATRHPLGHPEEGWRSHSISPPREGASFYGTTGLDTQYKVSSENLRWGWLRTDSEPLLSEDAIPGYGNLYRRDNATESYEAICPVQPPNEKPNVYVPEPQGFSADGSIAVFSANDRLLSKASSAKGIFQLYGCAAGVLELLSVLPGGKASAGNSSAGTSGTVNGDHRNRSLHNAVSEDGARVYWSDSKATDNPGRIYLRENPFAEGTECSDDGAPCTVAVSEAVGGPGAGEPTEFWTADTDGSVAIFRFTQGPLSANLYEFDAENQTSSLIAKGVSGLAGWSEDARRLYLVSTEVLAPGAVAGEPNLYFYEAGGGFDLIATLFGGTDSCIDRLSPIPRCTRASTDGRRLVLRSRDPLTGYDNADAANGKPATEAYLYDSEANGGAGELLCVSCNPTGARPAALNLFGSGFMIAADIPGWENAHYASRALSDDGRRLFFESHDALLPADTNGVLDVYQWQEAGKGDCDAADHNHFETNGGCLSLISSGKNRSDSSFVDASADGSDVFFKTAASLLPQDPGLVDIYDARVGGGFPIPPQPDPPCEGEACQSPPAPPDDPTPASVTSTGPGDLRPARARARCPKGKQRVARHGKSRCVKRQGARNRKRAQRRAGR
jgi:hypothetical protein